MSRTTLTRISLVLAMTAAPVAFLAAPATAAGLHPAPLCGALNMIEASPSYYGSNAVSDGMDVAMNIDNANGNAGMFNAVGVHSSGAQSPGCTG
jgi:hypothetical protein